MLNPCNLKLSGTFFCATLAVWRAGVGLFVNMSYMLCGQLIFTWTGSPCKEHQSCMQSIVEIWSWRILRGHPCISRHFHLLLTTYYLPPTCYYLLTSYKLLGPYSGGLLLLRAHAMRARAGATESVSLLSKMHVPNCRYPLSFFEK